MILRWFSELLRFAFPPRVSVYDMWKRNERAFRPGTMLYPDDQAREHEEALKIARNWQTKWGPKTRRGQK